MTGKPSFAARLMLLLSVAVSALAGTAWSLAIGPVSDDYSQIAAGRYILVHGIQTVDFISWTSTILRPVFVAHEWLYQVCMAWLYGLGGFLAINGYLLAVRLGIFALVAWLAWHRSGRRTWVAVASTLLVGGLLALSQTAADFLLALPSRPQTLSLLLLLSVAALLEKGGRWKWAVLPLLVLGANWHGGFWPLYVLVLGYYALRQRDWRLCLFPLALLLNPAGSGILMLPFAYAGGMEIYGNLQSEWGRTILWPGTNEGLVPFLGTALLLVGVHLSRPRKTDLLLLGALLLLALSGQRFVIFLIVLGIPMLSAYWPAIQERLAGLAGKWEGVLALSLAIFLFALPLLGTAGVVVADAGLAFRRGTSQDLPSRTVGGTTADINPVLDYIKSHGLTRVLNTSIPEGDYMAFFGVPPFIYNHSDVFFFKQADGSRLWSEYYAAEKDPARLDALVSKYGAQWLMDRTDGVFSDHVASHPGTYRAVFTAGKIVLYQVVGK